MSRIIIDVPVVAYKTWCISYGHIENREFVEEKDDRLLKDIKKMYPYDSENPHVLS